MGSLEHYSIGKRNLEKEHHWEELDAETFKITKPTVICFGGNCTKEPKDANAMCRIAQSLVGVKDPTTENEFATSNDVDFIGIGYGKNSDDSRQSSHLTDEESKSLSDRIFMPLAVDEKGKILPREQMLRNFNQITFFSHCHGAREIANLLRNGYKTMVGLGVDKQTAEDALNQVFSVSYAPMMETPCPSMQVIPEKDGTIIDGPIGSKISSNFLMDRFEGGGAKGRGTVAFKEKDNIVSLIVSHMTRHKPDEHGVGVVERDENWQMLETDIGFGNSVSKAMGNALARSVANSIQNQYSDTFIPKPTTDEILEETQSILYKSQNEGFGDYIEEIKTELNPPKDEEIEQAPEAQTPEVSDTLVTETTITTSPTEPIKNVSAPEPVIEDVGLEQ